MTQTTVPRKSPGDSNETLALSVVSFPTTTPLEDQRSSRNGSTTQDTRLSAETPQLPRVFVPRIEKPALVAAKLVTPTVTTVPVDAETIPPYVHSSDKSAIVTCQEDVEGQNPASRFSAKSGVWLSRLRRHCLHWLTAYRVLMAVTFIINAICLGLFIDFERPLQGVLVATAANLLISVLVRQEDLINLSFGLIAKIPSTLPLGLRKTIADFHHYGGVHIGCAVSALLWYGFFIYVNTRACMYASSYGYMTNWHWADIITCYLFLLFITAMCLTAIPRLREKLHNQFERIHRFGGWLSIAVLWINAGISTITTGVPLYRSISIWLLLIATLLILLPWLRIRSISITATPISAREVKLTFPYASMPYTSTARFSSNRIPILEWHAFATIPSPDGLRADIIISAAGDWTKSIIANPPDKIWIRNPPAANFLSFAPLFHSLLLIATGAGIGPMLSLLQSPTISSMRAIGKKIKVMWCVYEPDAPHWEFVQKVIRNVDKEPKIFDSRKGRPDVAFEAGEMMASEGIEGVMVVSNKKVTEEVVRGVKGRGGAAYGAVFDS
jgi:hypothetical protein